MQRQEAFGLEPEGLGSSTSLSITLDKSFLHSEVY